MQTYRTTMTGQILTALGLCTLLTAGLSVHAQTRAGSDGRALDANQQVGSGGYNPEDGRLDFSRRNDIITGNVGGGRAFQDYVGYGAVGEFQDTLGSDSLFNFRANSLSSSTSYLNAATIGGVGTQNNFQVYRSFTNRVAQPASPGLIAPQGGGYLVNPNQLSTAIQSRQLPTDAFSEASNRFAPGRALQAFTQAQGTGQDRVPVVTSEALNRRLAEEANDANDSPAMGDITDSFKFEGNVFDPFGGKAEDKKDASQLIGGQLPPTMMLGQQLQTQIDPNSTATIDPMRTQQVLDSLLQRVESPDTESSSSVYDNLLRDIKAGKKSEPAEDPWTSQMEAPTAQQVTEAERAYDDIMKEIYGEDYKTRRKASPSQSADQTEATEGEAGSAIDQLNYDLPRIKTLASDKKTRIDEMTREAEAALANGKYLTAENRYRQILLDTNNDPLPQAGLIHAQLGAGMFRSAGNNLRALFQQHPELIAARYDAKLLPPQERLEWIQQELQSVISQGEGGKDAPLLIAYLGYQANSKQLVRYGLALAQSKSPRDPLLLVVREIWLDEADTSDDGK